MRDYNFEKSYSKLLTPEIVLLLTKIHEFKGEQNLFIESKKDALEQLVEIAKIQSTEASNKIEGIYTSDERLRKIVSDKTRPRTRNEEEIAGYRDALSAIHESHDYMPAKPSVVLQLHKFLYRYSGKNFGGNYKSTDNVITEKDLQGNEFIRFKPVEAWITPEAMENLCDAFEKAMEKNTYDPLLLIPIFILDFLCIHPFSDGNGRMSRLLTLLLLYRAGYVVGKYISIEKIIERTKETYYETLQASSTNWHEEANDYLPFVHYMLGVVVAAYREFEGRVQVVITSGLSKPERVAAVLKDKLGKITKAEIVKECPDVGLITIERTLKELLTSNKIIKHGGGRYTAYSWNREND